MTRGNKRKIILMDSAELFICCHDSERTWLMFYFFINRKTKEGKQKRSKEIVDYNFDIFVYLHSSKITTSLQKPVRILGIDPGTLIMGV
jgi:hypothetical protein